MKFSVKEHSPQYGVSIVDVVDDLGHSILTVEYAGNHSGAAYPSFDDAEQAALIIRAVNSHDHLVTALEEVEQHLGDVLADDEPLLVRVRAALAAAQ